VRDRALCVDVINRFLALQRGVISLDGGDRIAAYCGRALEHLPGIERAWVCIGANAYPYDDAVRRVCETTCVDRHHYLDIDRAELEQRLGMIVFPMLGTTALRGMLLIKPSDGGQLELYRAMIAGFASYVGAVLGLHEARQALARENIVLRGDRTKLEDKVRERDRDLEFAVTHDQLTGLPNQVALEDRLSLAISYSGRFDAKIVVAYINLDNFTYVRDSYGVDSSNQILRIIAKRLRGICRPGDTAARLSADHFAMIVPMPTDEDPVVPLSRILAEVRRPINLGTRQVVVTSTVGCCVHPGDGDMPQRLLQRASIACNQGQQMARNRVYFYAAGDEIAVNDRAELESGLRLAVRHDQFALHYQPLVDLRTRKFVAMEALLRWEHPTRGQVSPAKFIPIAEESGAIFEIGEWALQSACWQAKAWSEGLGDGEVRVAVNLSARQLHDRAIVDFVRQTLDESGLPASALELEITESALMYCVERALPLLKELKDIGLTLAVDDFGTGYSNLHALPRLPVDILKIDQSLIRDATVDDNAAAVARGAIALGASLGLTVVAEGVESVEQAKFVLDAGCDQAQGYLFGRPMPADEAGALLVSPPPFTRIDALLSLASQGNPLARSSDGAGSIGRVLQEPHRR
jgi:diguanylate cyclase (GGDEF)-like protein